MLNKTEINLCKKYESNLQTAYYAQYTRQIPYDVQTKFADIIERETGKRPDVNPSCDHCVLYLAAKMARIYYYYNPDAVPEGSNPPTKI